MSVEQPETKAAIREIFLTALETQSPSEREAYLQGACGSDAALRAKVEVLLKSHEDDSFLESPAVEVAKSVVPTQESLTEGPGTVIGRYKLLERIGEGGFGIVYLAQQKEPVKRRVALKIIKVCQAVQHAHHKGVIYRDIKPSNILVTVNDGVAVPKIIDFGIAKATQAELTEKTVFTRFHQFLGTPAYMSQEQAEMTSLDIDTRSDIYSLGSQEHQRGHLFQHRRWLRHHLLSSTICYDPEWRPLRGRLHQYRNRKSLDRSQERRWHRKLVHDR